MSNAKALRDSSIHPAYARLLYVFMQERGVDVDVLFAQAGLRWTRVATDPSDLKFDAFGQVVLAAQQILQCPWLGLEMGSYGQVSMHGAVGHAAISSATLRQALQTLVRYGHLRCDALGYAFLELPAGGQFTIEVQAGQGPLTQFLQEAAFATLMRLMETAVGNVFSGVRVDLPFQAPAWQDRFHRYGLNRVQFDAKSLTLYFTPADLSLNCITADANSHVLALRECERALAAQRSVTYSQRVNHLLRSGAGAPFVFPALSELARELHVSSRTLIRKLKLEGSSYQLMLDALRKDQAVWQLSHTHDPIEQIAHRLGYRDASNFSRTFRRWYGLTPGDYRRGAVPSYGQQPVRTQ